MDAPPSPTPHLFWQGARATLPLLVGMVVFGLAYGLLAHTVGLTLAETVGMSALVLAGASQFVALGMIGAGTPAGLIVLSALFINLRHLLMGLALAPHLRRERWWVQALLAHGIVDESFVLASTHWAAHPASACYLAGIEASLVSFWLLSSAVGFWIGPALGDPRAWGLDFALPATFIGLLVPQLREGGTMRMVACVSGAVAVAGALILPNNWHLVVAALCAMLLGVALEARR